MAEDIIETEIPIYSSEDPDSPFDVVGENPGFFLVESTSQEPDHPMLTTDFSDYTVTEGLLLLILLLFFVSSCFKMLKEGFYWL